MASGIDRPIQAQCTSKRAYIFKHDAERVAAKRMAAGAGKLRVYKCTHCPCYHLTSKPYGFGSAD